MCGGSAHGLGQATVLEVKYYRCCAIFVRAVTYLVLIPHCRFVNTTTARAAADGENCCSMMLPKPSKGFRRGVAGSAGGEVSTILNVTQLSVAKARNMGVELVQQHGDVGAEGCFIPVALGASSGSAVEADEEDALDAGGMAEADESLQSDFFGPIGMKSRFSSTGGSAAGGDAHVDHKDASSSSSSSSSSVGYRKVLSFDDAEDIMLGSTSAKIAAASKGKVSKEASGRKKSICNQIMEFLFSY